MNLSQMLSLINIFMAAYIITTATTNNLWVDMWRYNKGLFFFITGYCVAVAAYSVWVWRG